MAQNDNSANKKGKRGKLKKQQISSGTNKKSKREKLKKQRIASGANKKSKHGKPKKQRHSKRPTRSIEPSANGKYQACQPVPRHRQAQWGDQWAERRRPRAAPCQVHKLQQTELHAIPEAARLARRPVTAIAMRVRQIIAPAGKMKTSKTRLVRKMTHLRQR